MDISFSYPSSFVKGLLRRAGLLSSPVPQQSGQSQLRMIYRFDASTKLTVPSVERGYHLVRYLSPDSALEKQWCEVLDRSGEFGGMTKKTLRREILSTLLPRGGAFIFHGDEMVACAAACFSEKYKPNSVLMFVVVLSQHRGKSLGSIVTLKVMRAAQQAGFPGMILHTDDHRLPAIKTYLTLGFVPDTDWEPGAKERWGNVLNKLEGHTKVETGS